MTALRQLKVTKTLLIWQACIWRVFDKSKKQPKISQILTSASYLFYVNLPEAVEQKRETDKIANIPKSTFKC